MFKPDIKIFSYVAVYIYHTTRHHDPQYSIAMFRTENFAVVVRTAPVHMLVQLWQPKLNASFVVVITLHNVSLKGFSSLVVAAFGKRAT